MAQLATYSKSAVGHIETGKRKPTPELASALDKALAANGLLIALASLQKAGRRNVDSVKRRDMLKAITAGTAALGASAFMAEEKPGRHVGQSDVDTLRGRTAHLRGLDNSLGGADTYGVYLAEVERTDAILRAATFSENVGNALLGVLAEQAQLAGWAAFDAGWIQQAQIHSYRSQAAAQQADDAALRANAVALRVYLLAFVGRADSGLAQASCELLSPGVPPRVRALILDRAAWSYALNGNMSGAERCLDSAAAAVAEASVDPVPDWAAWVDEKEIQIMSGRCWAALRRPLRAVPILSDVLADFPEAYARDKALYLLALAEALMHGSEIEQAAATINHAHGLAKSVASTRPKARLDLLRETLRADQPTVFWPSTQPRTQSR